MKVQILEENTTTTESLIEEFGLSFLIDYNGVRYLLDAGQTDNFMKNAETMHADLDSVKTAILSHAHYDHGGGFAAFCARYPDIHVYAMHNFDERHYFYSPKVKRDIGLQKSVLDFKDRFLPVYEFTQIADGVWLLPHSTPGMEAIGERTKLYKEVDGALIPDDFSHEMSVIFQLQDGLAVFNSCTHSGIRNVIREVQQQFPEQKIKAFFGGLHMDGKKHGQKICMYTRDEVRETAQEIRNAGIGQLGTGHCTGEIAFGWLMEDLGPDIVHCLSTGAVFELS